MIKKICLQYRRPGSDPSSWEHSLEQEMATLCSIHEWNIPWTEAPAKFMNPLVNLLGLQIYSVPFYFLTHTHTHAYWYKMLLSEYILNVINTYKSFPYNSLCNYF